MKDAYLRKQLFTMCMKFICSKAIPFPCFPVGASINCRARHPAWTGSSDIASCCDDIKLASRLALWSHHSLYYRWCRWCYTASGMEAWSSWISESHSCCRTCCRLRSSPCWWLREIPEAYTPGKSQRHTRSCRNFRAVRSKHVTGCVCVHGSC